MKETSQSCLATTTKKNHLMLQCSFWIEISKTVKSRIYFNGYKSTWLQLSFSKTFQVHIKVDFDSPTIYSLKMIFRRCFRLGQELYHNRNSYLFSQEAVSMSMLCDRDKLWDWVSRLLEGELERELTPSLLWLPYATPANVKDHKPYRRKHEFLLLHGFHISFISHEYVY